MNTWNWLLHFLIIFDLVAGQELELIAVHFDKDRMTLRVPMALEYQSL